MKELTEEKTPTIKESFEMMYNKAIEHSIEIVENYYNFSKSPLVDTVLDKIIEDLKKLK